MEPPVGCAPRRASLTYGELSSSSLLLCILLLQVDAFVNQSPSMATGLAPGGTRDYDTREFDVCRPWKGERGDAFLNVRPSLAFGGAARSGRSRERRAATSDRDRARTFSQKLSGGRGPSFVLIELEVLVAAKPIVYQLIRRRKSLVCSPIIHSIA